MMGPHRLSRIAEAVGGVLHAPLGDGPVTDLVLDSRRPHLQPDTLFVALRGERHDGHRYLADLVERGVRHALVSTPPAPELRERLNTILVPDTLEALHRLAAWHRGQFHGPVVGITGSNGKTVVKEWIAHLLGREEHIARSPGSWNSQVGVPLSVWALREGHSLGVFEAGISRPGEMAHLRPIIRPTIGVFTSLGPAHGENFADDRAKALEKLELFRDAQVLVYPQDITTLHAAVKELHLDQHLLTRTWSREGSAFLHLLREERVEGGVRLTVAHGAEVFAVQLPFDDHASVANAMTCMTLLLHLGRTPAWLQERLPLLHPVAMRLELLDGVNGSLLINDAYSNDTASLAIALDHLSAHATDRERIVVLGDIHESGEAPAGLYDRVAGLLQRARVERVLGVGPQLTAHAARFGPQARFFPDADALLREVPTDALRDAAVLVKGARSLGLERVVERWQRQVHGTVLEIDLEAVRHNLNHFRGLLRPGTGVLAMVKAFGYGSGATELARLFAYERVDMLGVAYADEGIALRQEGVALPILVMNPEPVPQEVLHRFRLEPVVYDLRSLHAAIDHARSHTDAPAVHLKIDTGMHRLGFDPDHLGPAIDALRHAPFLRISTVFSHFAASEDPAHDAFTRDQLARFTTAADRVEAVLKQRPKRHIANSAGISRFPEAHLDLVRPGIGLHGVGFDAGESAKLRPAARLLTTIAQVKELKAGDSVGYGRRHRVQAPQRIAVLPIGYADGLFRSLGHGVGHVRIHGRPAPFVGGICMDMCMVDVTAIACQPGDPVTVFGPERPLADHARDMGTIPYEALTAVSQRVKRVFVHG